MANTFIWRPAERAGPVVLYALLFIATLAAFYSGLQLGYGLAWNMVAVAVGAVALIAFCKWPILLFAGLVFVGEYKTIPAEGISLSDPTMLVFLLCCGAIAMVWVRGLISTDAEWSLGHLFAGQAFRVGLFLLFLALLAISFLYTPAEQYGRTKLVRFLTFESVAFFGPILLLKNEKTMRILLWAMIILSFPLLARQVMSVSHPSLQVLLEETDVTKIANGVMFGTAILIAIYAGLIRSRMLFTCLLVLLAVGLVTAAARTPALALVLTLIISSVVMGTGSRYLRLQTILPILLIIVVAVLTFSWIRDKPGMHDKLVSKENEFLAMASGSTETHGTMERRLEFYRSAGVALMEHPFTGLGLGGWSVFYTGERIEGRPIPVYPHNMILEVASEQGLPGLVMLLALLWSLFKSARKLAKYPQLAFLFPVLTFQLLSHVFTGTIEDRGLWFWFGMVIAASRMVHNSEMPYRAVQTQTAIGGHRKNQPPYRAFG
jgi:O-antigen ligase